MQRIGDELNSTESVVAAIESARLQAQPALVPDGSGMAEDSSALERLLTAIWKRALGRTHIGINENFFDAGGTSLKAVLVVAMIRKELKRNVSVVSLFECPTIRLLAENLDGSPKASENAAESRGWQRRSKLMKRRTA